MPFVGPELILDFFKLGEVSELRYVPTIKALLYKIRGGANYYSVSDQSGARKEVSKENAVSFINALRALGVLIEEKNEEDALVFVVKDITPFHDFISTLRGDQEDEKNKKKKKQKK